MPAAGLSQKPPPGVEEPDAWAAKVEWTFSTDEPLQSGHSGVSSRRPRTRFSNWVSQSEHWYSKIGISILIVLGCSAGYNLACRQGKQG